MIDDLGFCTNCGEPVGHLVEHVCPKARREAAVVPAGQSRPVEPAGEAEAFDGQLSMLLEEVSGFYRRYVRFPDEHGPAALALWTAATHAQDAFDVAPYINVSSAEKRSGKSRVLELAEQVVRKPLRVDNASPAYVYRTMAGATLLMDEADKVFVGKDEYYAALTGALNSGWRRGAGAGRVDKSAEGLKPVRFDAFGPKMLAGIGRKVPDTIQDRSIPLYLQRKAPSEQVARLRFRRALGRQRRSGRPWPDGPRRRPHAWPRPSHTSPTSTTGPRTSGSRSWPSRTRPAVTGRSEPGRPRQRCMGPSWRTTPTASGCSGTSGRRSSSGTSTGWHPPI
jgi:hypothetical protein